MDEIIDRPVRDFIPILADWYSDKYVEPVCLFLEAGGVYWVDTAVPDGLRPAINVDGYGYRYTVRTNCPHEDNYFKMFYTYMELYGKIGSWRSDDGELDIARVRVMWNSDGEILPKELHLADGAVYLIPETGIINHYPMSTRKSDGSGKRYILQGSCSDLRDYGRVFALMLEDGGDYIGRWFYEDYCEDKRVIHTIDKKYCNYK